MTLTCAHCATAFERPGRHGPVPRFCSIQCKARQARRDRPELRAYFRERARRQRMDGRRRAYDHEYNRRPQVMERARDRARVRYVPWEPLPVPYSGHRWLEMARAAVGPVDPEAPWAEDRHDEMGEALLALLEGRDMRQAVVDFRRREYVSRHLTIRADDWRESEDYSHWFDRVMPPAPSAEQEAIERISVTPRVHMGTNTRRFGNGNKQQQPNERRKRNR